MTGIPKTSTHNREMNLHINIHSIHWLVLVAAVVAWLFWPSKSRPEPQPSAQPRPDLPHRRGIDVDELNREVVEAMRQTYQERMSR